METRISLFCSKLPTITNVYFLIVRDLSITLEGRKDVIAGYCAYFG